MELLIFGHFFSSKQRLYVSMPMVKETQELIFFVFKDQRILLRMGEYARGLAYGYNVATGMATMTHGPLLTVMNADSYNLFATGRLHKQILVNSFTNDYFQAALFNRRQGTNVEANAGALQNAPSIYEQMGLFNVDGALIPGRFLDMDQRLVRLLRTLLLYRTVGALGKVRMF